MIDRSIGRAVVWVTDAGPVVRAWSPGHADDPEAVRLAAGFGTRPAGVACPHAVFAQPVAGNRVAVVRVADRPARPGEVPALGFSFLFLSRRLYEELGDPFAIAERYPLRWEETGPLPTLEWPLERLPARRVEDLQQVLKEGDGPLLLGATQGLIDGGRLALRRLAPDPAVVRGLWMLLPDSVRGHLWPASFAFGNALGFDVVVLPRADGGNLAGYMTDEYARDYPEGRYELNLQIAVESGDQRSLDALLSRRSSKQTLRLALYVLGAVLLLSFAMKLIAALPRPG